MKTVTVAIGNSDNKLPQSQWSQYCIDVAYVVKNHTSHVYAECYSLPNSAWQNAVFLFGATDAALGYLRWRLADLAKQYSQESIAMSVAEGAEMIVPEMEALLSKRYRSTD